MQDDLESVVMLAAKRLKFADMVFAAGDLNRVLGLTPPILSYARTSEALIEEIIRRAHGESEIDGETVPDRSEGVRAEDTLHERTWSLLEAVGNEAAMQRAQKISGVSGAQPAEDKPIEFQRKVRARFTSPRKLTDEERAKRRAAQNASARKKREPFSAIKFRRKYTRGDSLIDALRIMPKTLIYRKTWIEKANLIYVARGGADDIAVSRRVLDYVCHALIAAGVVQHTWGGTIKTIYRLGPAARWLRSRKNPNPKPPKVRLKAGRKPKGRRTKDGQTEDRDVRFGADEQLASAGEGADPAGR